MHNETLTVKGADQPGSDRSSRNEVAWIAVAAVLLALNSVDAVREIPPLADDYWMVESAPGAIAREYFRDYGWGRFLGIWLIDGTNTVRAVTSVPLFVVILFARVLVLIAVYFTLRWVFAFAVSTSLLAVGLMAWTPPATEGWALLCNLHLAVSALPVLVACGFYARSLGIVEAPVVGAPREAVSHAAVDKRLRWRWIVVAAAAQVVANFLYEQALLSVPAFALVLAVAARGARQQHLRQRAAVVAVATSMAVMCLLVMLLSGYVGGRAQASTSSSAELSDAASALEALWLGFVQHHLWRAVEVVRTQRVLWWDASLLGVAAAVATLAASAVVAHQLIRERARRPGGVHLSLSVAALVAAYAAFLLTGLAYPGYTIFSRLYYIPGVFIAVALASLAHAPTRIPRIAIGLAAGTAMVWLGIVTRRYYEDTRLGSRILRVVARSIAGVPSAVRADGLLVVAPSNVGTFSTSAVEPWSLRPAVRALTGVNPEGPLLLTTDCGELARERPRVNAETERARPAKSQAEIGGEQWAAVIRYQAGGVQTAPSVAVACAQ